MVTVAAVRPRSTDRGDPRMTETGACQCDFSRDKRAGPKFSVMTMILNPAFTSGVTYHCTHPCPNGVNFNVMFFTSLHNCAMFENLKHAGIWHTPKLQYAGHRYTNGDDPSSSQVFTLTPR